MEKKKSLNIIFLIIALIVGGGLWREFDPKNFKFNNPWLAFIYASVFLVSVSILIKGYIKRPGK